MKELFDTYIRQHAGGLNCTSCSYFKLCDKELKKRCRRNLYEIADTETIRAWIDLTIGYLEKRLDDCKSNGEDLDDPEPFKLMNAIIVLKEQMSLVDYKSRLCYIKEVENDGN